MVSYGCFQNCQEHQRNFSSFLLEVLYNLLIYVKNLCLRYEIEYSYLQMYKRTQICKSASQNLFSSFYFSLELA